MKKNKPLVIGISGSSGKSTTTKLVADTLKFFFNTKYTHKGNSETGIPFEILNIPVKNYTFIDWPMTLLTAFWNVLFDWEKYSILVAEMGIDSDIPPNDMDTLLNIIHPDIGIILNVNSVHLENFKNNRSIKDIAQEKIKLATHIPKNGFVVLNKDQEELYSYKNSIKAQIGSFSINKAADIKLKGYSVSLKGTIFEVSILKSNYRIIFKNQIIIKEFFGSISSLLLIAQYLKLDLDKVIDTMESSFETLPGRGRLLKGINQSILIDSSYNSSLIPTQSSLNMLNEVATNNNRKIAILGDMRELGKREKIDHESLEETALTKADIIISVGPLTQKYFKSKKIIKFKNAFETIPFIKKIIKPKDTILIKGSQNTILLEIIVEALLKNKSDKKKLCRQSYYWEKQRSLIKNNH